MLYKGYPIKKGTRVCVPNTFYVHIGSSLPKFGGLEPAGWETAVQRAIRHAKSAPAAKGCKLVVNKNATAMDAINAFRDMALFGYSYLGHGAYAEGLHVLFFVPRGKEEKVPLAFARIKRLSIQTIENGQLPARDLASFAELYHGAGVLYIRSCDIWRSQKNVHVYSRLVSENGIGYLWWYGENVYILAWAYGLIDVWKVIDKDFIGPRE